jgi:hypothetical protein
LVMYHKTPPKHPSGFPWLGTKTFLQSNQRELKGS